MVNKEKSRFGLTIDHVLIAVKDLKQTADVFNNLGFTVTPENSQYQSKLNFSKSP